MNDLHALDAAHVWHPFTAMPAYYDEAAPIILEADGFHLIDTAGRRYLDGHSSLWCNIHGHRVPEIDRAIAAQMQRVSHTTLLGLGNEPSIELAFELVRRAPHGLTKAFYSDCGAAGVEVALKLAYQFHRQKSHPEPQRERFVGLTGAYHGDTVGTVSLGGIERFHSLFSGLMFPTLRVPTPATQGLSLEQCLAETEAILAKNAEQIAGFVIEPLVQAAAGILVHPPGYLRAIRALTRKLGILLIADEIAVGFGRTGTLFACEHEQVVPDLMILSKGLTGGYLPLAATLATEEIFAAFLGEPWSGRTFYHGHTYTGNPLACSAALASLRLIEARGVLENAERIADILQTEFPTSFGGEQVLVRQRGAMLGLELRDACGSEFPPPLRIGHRVTLACRQRGVVLRNIGDVVVVMPAPAMPVDLVRQLCVVIQEAVGEVLSEPD